jgi:hypothetical protein
MVQRKAICYSGSYKEAGIGKSNGLFEISQIPVDSFTETSGGGTMVSQASNRYDSSPATTSQRSPDEVYQTPRFSAPDPD